MSKIEFTRNYADLSTNPTLSSARVARPGSAARVAGTRTRVYARTAHLTWG